MKIRKSTTKFFKECVEYSYLFLFFILLLLLSPLILLLFLILKNYSMPSPPSLKKTSESNFFKVGAFFSIIYCFVLFIVIFLNNFGFSFFLTSNLNEVGDFLAGAFSPLAFLWLVIGFWMQSHELSLQRKELSEQRDVAEKQAKSLDIQTQFMLALEPEFTFKIVDVMYEGPNGDTSNVVKEIEILNKGAIATNVVFIIKEYGSESKKSVFETIEKLNLRAPPDILNNSGDLTIDAQYNNAVGKLMLKKYLLTLSNGFLIYKVLP